MLFWELEIEDVKKTWCHSALNMTVQEYTQNYFTGIEAERGQY